MAREKSKNGSHRSVRTGNITGNSGPINIAAGNIRTETHTAGTLNVTDVKLLFGKIYSAIDESTGAKPTVKEDVKAEVQDLQAAVTEAVQKKAPVDESFLARRFRNIARMAPDILDVIVATLGSPLAGLGVAVKKIAEKAKAETVQA